MLKKPWIKVSDTVTINLNYIIKIVRQANSTAVEGIMFFHASSGTGSNQFVGYADSTEADAAFAEILALMDSNAALVDLT